MPSRHAYTVTLLSLTTRGKNVCGDAQPSKSTISVTLRWLALGQGWDHILVEVFFFFFFLFLYFSPFFGVFLFACYPCKVAYGTCSGACVLRGRGGSSSTSLVF